jgi:AMMECR1 domain-containing protein
MAKAAAGALTAAALPYRALRRPLTVAERGRLSRHLARLVEWQRTLGTWPRLDTAPDATPFVSVHARERLAGCFGSEEGAPSERIGRAFLRAIADARNQPLSPSERGDVTAQVSYVIGVERVEQARAAQTIEVGTHGVASRSAILLPDVARDNGWDASQLLEALARKQGSALEDVWIFRTERVSSARSSGRDPRTLAIAWLEGLVDEDGAMTFAIDPRRRARELFGVMHHGRAAVVVQALSASSSKRGLVKRARQRLLADIRRALAGAAVDGWPSEPPTVIGTLALACRAGLPLVSELRDLVDATPDLATNPWHAAQAIAVLGEDAPPSLWQACVRDTERRPFAPWTLIAARARHDAATEERLTRALTHHVRARPPHEGGAELSRVPEIALTAVAVEALLPSRDPKARAAAARGQEFLRRWQLLGDRIPPAYDVGLALGAFPGSPVSDVLRGDISAHALVACWPLAR